MFENKLAHSVQRDYRQSADIHRLTKGSKFNRSATVAPKLMLFGGLISTVFLLI